MREAKAVLTQGDGTLEIGHIQVGTPGADEVLVRMKAAGLCHTDYDSLSWGMPLVVGHEGAGEVIEVGSEVSHVRSGDRVVLTWAMHCGHCRACKDGMPHLCQTHSPVIGSATPFNPGHAHKTGTLWQGQPIQRSFNLGTLSEHTLVKAGAVVKNPVQEMSDAAASILSCGVMTGFGSVHNAARVQAGSTVVVLGAGGVGLNVIQGARIAGASKIIAIDLHEKRLEMARHFGATHCIQSSRDDAGLLQAAKQLKTLNDGAGADFAFECTAVPALGAAPLAMIRHGGMAVQVSGIEQAIDFDMELFEWDKLYINPLYGQCNPERDFPRLMEHYRKKALNLEDMITRTYPLDAVEQAFQDMLGGKNAKGVLVF